MGGENRKSNAFQMKTKKFWQKKKRKKNFMTCIRLPQHILVKVIKRLLCLVDYYNGDRIGAYNYSIHILLFLCLAFGFFF